VRHVEHMGEMRNAYKILFGKPDRKRPLERPRHGLEDNIRMDAREIGFEAEEWMHVAQVREQWWAPVNTVMNIQVP